MPLGGMFAAVFLLAGLSGHALKRKSKQKARSGFAKVFHFIAAVVAPVLILAVAYLLVTA